MREVFRDTRFNAALMRDGIVVLDLLDHAAVDHLTDAYHREAGDLPDYPFFTTIMSANAGIRQRVDQAVREVLAPRVLPLLADYRIAVGSFLVKRNHPGSAVHLHQDWSFVDETTAISLGLWCPLSDVDETNGCLWFIKASHLLNRTPRGWTASFPYPHLLPDLVQNYLKPMPARAGQCFIFAHGVMHASKPNTHGPSRVAAACIAAPLELPLIYHHTDDAAHPAHYRAFEVPDDYFVAQDYRSVPVRCVDHGLIPKVCAPLDRGSFEQLAASHGRAIAN
jgi:hypothetical protein